MRLLLFFLCALSVNIFLHAAGNDPLESDEALRARIKIKFALDPLLSKEKITLQHQNGQLSLVGQVESPIIEEQALYLIQQSKIKPGRIRNEIIVENKNLTPGKKQELVITAAKARLEAAGKYEMKNIPFIGIKLGYKDAILTVEGNLNSEQKKEIRETLQNFKEIQKIKFIEKDSVYTR